MICYAMMRHKSIRYNTTRHDRIGYDTIRYDATPYDMILHDIVFGYALVCHDMFCEAHLCVGLCQRRDGHGLEIPADRPRDPGHGRAAAAQVAAEGEAKRTGAQRPMAPANMCEDT